MTPAIASGPERSAMISVSGASSRSTWSSVSSRSPGSGAADDDPAAVRVAGDRGRVEGVDGLAQLEHHVVGGVDDVADRPHAGRQQPHLDRVRRRPDADAADPAAHEAGAQVRVLDLDRQAVGDRHARLLDARSSGEADRRAGRGRHLAREADQAQGVAAVGLHVDVEDHVAVQVGQGGPKRRAGGRIRIPSASLVRWSSSPEQSMPF